MTDHRRETDYEGREKYEVDIDRMINEGLGGGQVREDSGLIDESRPLADSANRPLDKKKER